MTWYTFINQIKYYMTEKVRGIDFSRSDFSYVKENSPDNYYSRTDHSTLKQLRECLKLTKNDAILDIGCGKGAVLYYFARHTEACMCGIEKFEGLAQIARDNFRVMKMEDRVTVFTCDALEFERYDGFNCFFLFNPFNRDVAQKVLSRITASVKQKPRRIRLVSVQPFFNEMIKNAGFKQERVIRSGLTGVETFVYLLDMEPMEI